MGYEVNENKLTVLVSKVLKHDYCTNSVIYYVSRKCKKMINLPNKIKFIENICNDKLKKMMIPRNAIIKFGAEYLMKGKMLLRRLNKKK